jgi:hypothetical protein
VPQLWQESKYINELLKLGATLKCYVITVIINTNKIENKEKENVFLLNKYFKMFTG